MDTIYSLLNINADIIRDFPLQANLVDDKGTERILHQNQKKLSQIEMVHDSDVECKIPKHSIDAVVQKILRNAVKGETEQLSIAELRIISYNLSQLHGEDSAYYYALDLLFKEWRDMFFNGIASYLLSSWNRIREDYLSRCCDLFGSKLQGYSGNIKRHIKLKENIDFFKEGGPLRLGALVARKGMELKEAPSVFGYKQSAFAHSYFSDVIIKYVKDANITDVDFLEDEIFSYHKEDRTKKLVFADLVLTAEQYGDSIKQRKVSNVARRVLGDITLASTWAPFQGATEEDRAKLKRASELVNFWINRRVIEAFFEVCVQDKTRERFWAKYAKEVTGFKIVGSTLVKRSLQQDPRIDFQTLNRCFVETNSNISKTAALILVFKGKAVIEFSDVGSVYAYNVANRFIAPILKGKRFIEKTDELKDTSLPILVESQGYYSWLQEEGRLTHRGEWESRLRRWLNDKVFVATNVAPNLNSVSERVFQANPIMYDRPKIQANQSPDSREETKVKGQNVIQKSLFDSLERGEEENKTAKTVEVPSRSNPLKEPWITLKQTILTSSKLVFEGLCQVIGTEDGFYLHIITNQHNRYAKIKDFKINVVSRGNIWIKSPLTKNWYPVVYAQGGKEINIGLIKYSKGRVLYRVSSDHPECKSFPTK